MVITRPEQKLSLFSAAHPPSSHPTSGAPETHVEGVYTVALDQSGERTRPECVGSAAGGLFAQLRGYQFGVVISRSLEDGTGGSGQVARVVGESHASRAVEGALSSAR
ncbi:MAG: hypothetical protein J07HX64_00817 [halophilic archaeon J07HX64]|nr:MAG: hypothetical protein J07HX64_00817 [halophilic archaeon J07HX64]